MNGEMGGSKPPGDNLVEDGVVGGLVEIRDRDDRADTKCH